MSRALVAVLVVASCTHEPTRTTTTPSPSPSPSTTPPPTPPQTPASETPPPPPEQPTFSFLPKDLRDRGPSLVDIQCPPGTTRIEKQAYGETHRHCETPNGTYEGPIVQFSPTSIHLRGTHNGLREGIELDSNEGGGAVEAEFKAGHPIGHYRYRTGTVTVAEGDFDSDGKLDGDWVFRIPVSGSELSKTKLSHGTGSIELWDWRYGQPQVMARYQCKDGLLDGTQMFHRLSAPGIMGLRVEGDYRAGLPDGNWKLIRIKDNLTLASGKYKAGKPIGTWKMVAERPCLAMMRGGDSVDCIYGEDLPYTCTGAGTCKFDKKPAVRGGQDIEPVEHDREDVHPPRVETYREPCDLGEPYISR